MCLNCLNFFPFGVIIIVYPQYFNINLTVFSKPSAFNNCRNLVVWSRVDARVTVGSSRGGGGGCRSLYFMVSGFSLVLCP